MLGSIVLLGSLVLPVSLFSLVYASHNTICPFYIFAPIKRVMEIFSSLTKCIDIAKVGAGVTVSLRKLGNSPNGV